MSGTHSVPVADAGIVAQIEALTGLNLYSCYQCGKCTASCPFGFSPQELVRLVQLGQLDEAYEQKTLRECASCFTCTRVCPRDVNPAKLVHTLREHQEELRANGNVSALKMRNNDKRSVPGEKKHSLRSKVFAGIHDLSIAGSKMAPLSNWALKMPGASLVNHHVLGVHKDRVMPPFAEVSFESWFKQHKSVGDARKGKVVLFHDTFMNYNYPVIGIATTELLEKLGFEVELANRVCCGRPMISKGFYEKAAGQAEINVRQVYEQTGDAVFMVGCEPSCLLSFRDEYPEMVSGSLKTKAKSLAKRTLLIDEFLAMLKADGEIDVTFTPPAEKSKRVLYHAHCHQKALAKPLNGLEMLQAAGYDAEMVQTPCCGMAGSFGFEKEHYDLSKAAGESGLFPALRAEPDAQVAVMGVSCRQQIEQFLGRKARHVTELLRDALPDKA